nr:MAG TPA: outer membrane protein assembly factor [Caudoviricetes sp.]
MILCKRTKLATFITLLCILFSGCTAHSINNNIQVSLCVKAI